MERAQENIYYRALVSRDRRFEGHFVVGVTSTGIYCRPGCPARRPRREHLRFFATRAGAEAAGFRPCLRCRPDAQPDLAAANGSAGCVQRALRLIAEGALDAQPVDVLAERIGLGSRHLRRLFLTHVGASPGQVARTRRLHFARALLEDTTLPFTEVADRAGFGSLRQFNDAMRAHARRTPTQLRRRARPAGTGLTLRLRVKLPYDTAGIFAFLGRRAVPGVEQVEGLCYRRTAELAGQPFRLEVRGSEDGSLLLRLPDAIPTQLAHVVARVRRLFDCGADPVAVEEALGSDPLLRPAIRRAPGLRVPGAWDGFELAVRVVLGQQISVGRARTLAARLVEAFGRSGPFPPGAPDRLFPPPEVLADVPIERIGLPRARGATLRALAAAVAEGRIALDGTQDAPSARERLRAVPGIGPWTVEMIALRALGDPDALPASDLGLRKALGRNGRLASERQVVARAERWRPWRAYGTLLSWKRLEERP